MKVASSKLGLAVVYPMKATSPKVGEALLDISTLRAFAVDPSCHNPYTSVTSTNCNLI